MITHDIHIHTHLSDCAKRDAFMEGYIAEARNIGLKTLGFSDHSWDSNVEGASNWYKPQTFKRLESRREEIKSLNTDGLKILLGAEGEFANFLLGISEDAKNYVDYIIVPHSHTHMKGFVMPSEYAGDAQKHANFLVNSFIALCNHEKRSLFFGIAHPMWPVGASLEYITEIFHNISDEELAACAKTAKEANIALELNISSIQTVPESIGSDFCMRRFFDACKKEGCQFFLGSDAHSIPALTNYHAKQEYVISIMGLDESDFKSAEELILNM
jgi:histidinol-phosphatase (PHP family)